ncbi:hypothetical protein SAMN04488136_102119 [Vibrio xiamenensis]|uniref:Uncharacterized protein n=1 Tax=Vibrio xiamenensis TaxID=861298 RepID=A0A1G7WR60_9VIBR|nr:hypothetical protein SAMN04488136_102119 [Vibrio xiamenensis]
MALFCGEKLAKEKTKIAKARSLRVNSSNNETALRFMNDIVQKTKKALYGPFGFHVRDFHSKLLGA